MGTRRSATVRLQCPKEIETKWGGPPGPRGPPDPLFGRRLFRQQADEGVGSGPGGPPHLVFQGAPCSPRLPT
jgi:hypothetical protein